MPLYTQIIRKTEEGKEEPLTLNWGWWHVQTMQDVAAHEEGVPPEEWHQTSLARTGVQIVQCEWRCVDPADGEELLLHPGDKLIMHR